MGIEHDRVVPTHRVEEMTLYILYIVNCDYFIDELLNLNRSCSWDSWSCSWDSWSCSWDWPCGWGNWSYCWDCTWDLRECGHKAHRCSACNILGDIPECVAAVQNDYVSIAVTAAYRTSHSHYTAIF